MDNTHESTPPFAPSRFGGEQQGPRLLITAGVHGDELEPVAAMHQLARWLVREPIQGSLTIVPVANEDAFSLGHRFGSDGLDLARTFPGRLDGSRTERVAYHLATLIREADYYLDLHTGGAQLQVLTLAGYLLHDDHKVLQTQRRLAQAAACPFVWGTAADCDGRTLSVARDAGVPAIYIEHQGGGGFHPGAVQELVKTCLNVMATLEMLERPPKRPRPKWIVEDESPGSGDMQSQHRAPCAGCFEPKVTLGGFVNQGQPLGHIVTLAGEDLAEVPAERAGLVIVLHRFGPVVAGEGLGVVVDPPLTLKESS